MPESTEMNGGNLAFGVCTKNGLSGFILVYAGPI